MRPDAGRAYADFLAEHEIDVAEAVRLARKEFERRPGHLHALETYAWALHRAGRSGEAVSLIERAIRLGKRDAMMYVRGAEIFDAVGDGERADRHRAIALEYNLSVQNPALAREMRAAMEGRRMAASSG